MKRLQQWFLCILAVSLAMSGTAHAAGVFKDPFSEKGSGVFEDPFKDTETVPDRTPLPENQPKENNDKKEAGDRQYEMPGTYPGKTRKGNALENPRELTGSRKEKPKTTASGGETKTLIAPFGVSVGDKWQTARARVGSAGFVSLGPCGKGELFTDDPAGLCVRLLMNGNGKHVTGGSFFVSDACLADDTRLSSWAAFAEKKVPGGYELSDNAMSTAQCPNTQPLLSADDMPKFLGFITRHMDRKSVAAAIGAMGGRKTGDFSDGEGYDLSGTDVVVEYCPDGTMISIALRVNREDPSVRRLIDMMNVQRETVFYENATIRAKFRNGKVTHCEFMYDDTKKRCLVS